MPRRCTVCDHPESHSIDQALVTGAPYRSVAKRFGLSESAVYRHKTEHLPARLLKAKKVEELAQADDLLEQVRHLQARALDILDFAEKAGDLRTALAAISQARGNLELLGKLVGELDERPVVNLNVSAEWLELRAVIVGALEPHAEAHRAVYQPGSLILCLAPALRQSQELFGKVLGFYRDLDRPIAARAERRLSLELENESRIVTLPGTEKTIRGFSGAALLIVDEASRVTDELYFAVRPMLAVSGGSFMMLSTPYGKRGIFYEEWTGGSGWERYEVPASEVPRISPE